MSATARETINEVDFCAKIAAAAGPIFQSLGDRCPFNEARVEGMGSTTGKSKRKDLRFYDLHHSIKLTGEVKLPGGVSAFDTALIQDAQQKADHAGVQYFFTWDVNTFVLWDRYQQDKPLLERRIRVWQLRLNLTSAQELARPEILDVVTRKFLPDLISDLSDIVTGRRRDWSLPPDEIFLRSLESHLDWPVMLLRQYLYRNAEMNRRFDNQLQKWLTDQGRPFLRNQPEEWRDAIDNAARTLAYVWTNRFIFYKALRARFPQLPKLELASNIKTPKQAVERLDTLFRKAADESGDYETLLFPNKHDWANDEVFTPDGAIDAWRGFLHGIEAVDFRDVPADVVGLIFQKLVSPEERHRLGQHFTGPEPVDLINSFCIRTSDAIALDPACGSGSFLVRAYYRKRTMTKRPDHAKLLRELYGCDIALYPAHLATLNLAAREINDEANYPRIARENFFDIVPQREFCELPTTPGGEREAVHLPALDAIVGNPPYVRQEKISPTDKAKAAARVAESFPGVELTGRADLHCYFWPHATRFLKEDGYFGFLTSGQWLDVDYGFALQRWILKNFRIVAILESSTERWFVDARVKTCITILQRCSDAERRDENMVRFVRFEKPLVDLFGVVATGGVGADVDMAERKRQAAVDAVRDELESLDKDLHDDRWRVLLKPQMELWEEGVQAGQVLRDATIDEPSEDVEDEEAESETVDGNGQHHMAGAVDDADYVAGKWGRFLRAPDLYFEVMQEFGASFVPLGEIIGIRFGVKSGCDAFFMPRDVTAEMLASTDNDKEFKRLTGVNRSEVESGAIQIVKDGAGTIHAIEAKYLKPEVHSLMKVDRPIVRAADLDRVVLLVPSPVSAIRGTHAYRYVKYGETATYASKKSKAVPVPQRSTCAARDPWYDLTKLVDPGFALWPMAQQYRHIIPGNPESLICNHNLFDMDSAELTKREKSVLVGILNSTVIGLFKTFYGRFAGTEGNLKTEVVDVNLLDVPDPRGVDSKIADRIIDALKRMTKRNIGRLVEESLMECHSYERAMDIATRPYVLSNELQQPDRRDLDDAVFELLGVKSASMRRELVDRLHKETALHFRAIRVTEIQKMEDRRSGGPTRFSITDHAADIWDAVDLTDLTPLAEWVRNHAGKPTGEYEIPDERPAHLDTGGMFDQETVYFGKKRELHIECPSRGTAEMLQLMANRGVSGSVTLPIENNDAMKLLDKLEQRHKKAIHRLKELTNSRISEEEQQAEVLAVLERWFVLGRTRPADMTRRAD